jgi:hypothetical protein
MSGDFFGDYFDSFAAKKDVTTTKSVVGTAGMGQTGPLLIP